MKKLPMLSVKRNRELGTVAILVSVMWTALFGMAVLAVDFGYLYTKRRGVQAVTDAAVRASMPAYMTNGFTQATTRARAIASANGYVDGASDGTTVQFDEPVANQFRMRIARTYPTFFGSLFGLNSKRVTGTTIGRVVPSASTAATILALGGSGVRIAGNTTLIINGDVKSNGPLEMCGGPARTYTTNGDVLANPGSPTACFGVTPPLPGWDIVTGTVGAVGVPFTDPFATALPTCTTGNMGAPLGAIPMGPGPACPAGNCYIPPGIYCSSADININPSDPCGCIHTDPAGAGVTFVSAGVIQIGGNGGGYLKPNNSVTNPNKIIFLAQGAASPAFNFGGCAVGCGGFTFDGAIYTPNGQINMGTQDPMVINGSLIGREVMLGLGTTGPFTITGNGAGGGGSTWSIFQ